MPEETPAPGDSRYAAPLRPSPFFSSSSDARAATLQGLLIATIVICALYFGREVLLPLALAILLSFVLTRPLILLRRVKVPRLLAVGIVVGFAFVIIVALGWLLSREAADLAADLPRYQTTLLGEDQESARFHGKLAGAAKSRQCAQQFAERAVRSRRRELSHRLPPRSALRRRSPTTSRWKWWLKSASRRRSRFISRSPARCCRRSPPPASCCSSSCSSCCSARICATG